MLIVEQIFGSTTIFEFCIIAVVVIFFVIQSVIYIGYSLVATHRHRAAKPSSTNEDANIAVSIVAVVGTDFRFLDDTLPLLLAQQYNGDWEVVVVNDCGGVDIENELERIALSDQRLRYTTIRADKRFKHSRKIPLLIGIKAARYPSILVADPSAAPTTDKWLALMARGFESGELVIGYTGFGQDTNPVIRSSRFLSSVRYLKAAIMGEPYRGIYNNIGYTKELFFKSRGFTHLRLTLGEDDLFVQKIAPYCHTSVMLNPVVMMQQHALAGIGWWWNEQCYRTYSFKYYPRSVRFSSFLDLSSRFLLIVSLIVMALLSIQYIWIYALGVFLLRELTVIWIARRIMKRLGEKGFMATLLIYELFEPISASVLSLARRIRPSSALWK